MPDPACFGTHNTLSLMKEVLVLLPTARDRRALAPFASSFHFRWQDDEAFADPQPAPHFDLVQYTERCSAVIRRHKIAGVFYSHDLANLVAGVLCDRHGLPGPTLEAVFLSNHKYYSRTLEPDPIRFDYIDLESAAWGRGQPRYPCYLKPPLLMRSLLQQRVSDADELERALELIRRELPAWSRLFHDFFDAYLDVEKYPLAVKNILVAEELVEGASQHVVEGWTSPQGEAYLWALADATYFESHPAAIDVFITPSRQAAPEQAKLAAYALETVQRHRLSGGFWNVELWATNSRIQVTEVNSRVAAMWEHFYRGTYHRSLYHAAVSLCVGDVARCLEETPRRPPGWRQRSGGQFHVVTYGEGLAADLIDFEAALPSNATLEYLVAPGDRIRQTHSGGVWLALFHLFGPDFRALRLEADRIRARLLKQPDQSPWSDRGGPPPR